MWESISVRLRSSLLFISYRFNFYHAPCLFSFFIFHRFFFCFAISLVYLFAFAFENTVGLVVAIKFKINGFHESVVVPLPLLVRPYSFPVSPLTHSTRYSLLLSIRVRVFVFIFFSFTLFYFSFSFLFGGWYKWRKESRAICKLVAYVDEFSIKYIRITMGSTIVYVCITKWFWLCAMENGDVRKLCLSLFFGYWRSAAWTLWSVVKNKK